MNSSTKKDCSAQYMYPFESEAGTIHSQKDHDALMKLRAYDRARRALAVGGRYATLVTSCMIH